MFAALRHIRGGCSLFIATLALVGVTLLSLQSEALLTFNAALSQVGEAHDASRIIGSPVVVRDSVAALHNAEHLLLRAGGGGSGLRPLPPPAQCAAHADGVKGIHATFRLLRNPDAAALRRGCGTLSARPAPFSDASSRFILFEPVLSGWNSQQPRASNSFANYQMALLVGLLSGRTVVMPPYWAPNPATGGSRAVRPYVELNEQRRAGIAYDAPEDAPFGTGRANAWDPFSSDPLEGLFDIDALRRCALGATEVATRADHRGVLSWSEFEAEVEALPDAELTALFAEAKLVCGKYDGNSLCGCGRNGVKNANRTGSNPLLLLSARVRAAANAIVCEHPAKSAANLKEQNDFMLLPRPRSRVVVVANCMMEYWLWRVYAKDLRGRGEGRGLRGCVASCALVPQPHFMAAADAYRDALLQGGAYHAIHIRMNEAESRLDELYDMRIGQQAAFASTFRWREEHLQMQGATWLASLVGARAVATGFNLTYIAAQRRKWKLAIVRDTQPSDASHRVAYLDWEWFVQHARAGAAAVASAAPDAACGTDHLPRSARARAYAVAMGTDNGAELRTDFGAQCASAAAQGVCERSSFADSASPPLSEAQRAAVGSFTASIAKAFRGPAMAERILAASAGAFSRGDMRLSTFTDFIVNLRGSMGYSKPSPIDADAVTVEKGRAELKAIRSAWHAAHGELTTAKGYNFAAAAKRAQRSGRCRAAERHTLILPHAERVITSYVGRQFEIIAARDVVRAGEVCTATLLRFRARVAKRAPFTVLLFSRAAVAALHVCAAEVGTPLGALQEVKDAGTAALRLACLPAPLELTEALRVDRLRKQGKQTQWTSPVFLQFDRDVSPVEAAQKSALAAATGGQAAVNGSICDERIDCVEDALRLFLESDGSQD